MNKEENKTEETTISGAEILQMINSATHVSKMLEAIARLIVARDGLAGRREELKKKLAEASILANNPIIRSSFVFGIIYDAIDFDREDFGNKDFGSVINEKTKDTEVEIVIEIVDAFIEYADAIIKQEQGK